MRTLLKIIAGLAVALLVLFIVAAVLLTQFFDPNAFKGQIAQTVKESTGRDLVIPGDIELTYFPWLGFEIGEVRLGNPSGFGDTPFLTLDGAGARIKLLPLLSRRVEIATVTVRGARANLVVDAAGENNWTFAGTDAAPGAPDPKKPQREAGAGAGTIGLAALSIGGVEVTDGAVTYTDASSGTEASVTDLTLTVGAIASGDPVAMAFSGNFAAGEPQLAGAIDLETQLQIELDAKRIGARDFQLTLEMAGSELPSQGISLVLRADLQADLAADQLMVEPLNLTLAGLDADGQLKVSQLTTDPAVDGSLQLKPFNLKKVLSDFGVEQAPTADPKALTALALTMQFSADADQANLSGLALTLDDTRITGSAAVANFDAPAVNFDIRVDAIDIDRYLSATSEEAVPQSAEAAEPVNVAAAVGGIAALNADGKLTIDRVKVANLNATDISATLKARQGLVTLAPLGASLYEGGFEGSLTLDGRQEQVQISTSNRLSGVQIGPLLVDAAQFDRVTGTANVTADLTANGATSDDLIAALNGKLGFDIADGLLRGINIDRAICQARGAARQLQGKVTEQCDAQQDTRFNVFRANAVVTNGVARNDDLLIEQQRYEADKLLHISGAGSVDLPRQGIDYRIQAVRMERAEDGSLSARDTPIPVRVTGTFDNIKAVPDLSGLVKEEARSKLQEKLGDKLKDEEGDSEGDKLKKDLLRGLFGQ